MRSPSGIDTMPSSFWLLPLLLWAGTVFAEPPAATDFPRIEVFTLSGHPIEANTAAISPVQDRFQHLDRATSDSLRQSAVGLAKAMQYGIDRIPAVVFDGQAVVYGVTDISAALAHYQAWQSGKRP